METPDGKQVGEPKKTSIIVPGNVPHKLTITGTVKRASVGIIVADNLHRAPV
jgi:hypothetical protein